MGDLIILGVLICTALVLASGPMAMVSVRRSRTEIDELKRALGRIEAALADSAQAPASAAETATPPPSTEPADARRERRPREFERELTSSLERVWLTEPAPPHPLSRLRARLAENWMLWLGALSVALAGIFLAKYSIERGLLGPTARVVMGIVTGLALHAAAGWLRRRKPGVHLEFAALAGCGSITLYAALVAALNLYHLISPAFCFLWLAAVALATMPLALLYGPLLAAIGIVGAYLVPAMVATEEGNALVALGYSAVISASALLLLRYVYRPWLWWGCMAGGLGWWLLTIASTDADGIRGPYLALFAYLMLALPGLRWRLDEPVALARESYRPDNLTSATSPLEQHIPLGAFLILVAQALSILAGGAYDHMVFEWCPLPIVFLLAARHRENLYPMPWLLLIGTSIAWILLQTHVARGGTLELSPLANELGTSFHIYLAVTAALYSVLALRNFAAERFKGTWSSLACLAPLVLMTLAYVLTDRPAFSWGWGTFALVTGLAYLASATAVQKKRSPDSLVVWLFCGGHYALSFAAVILLEPATITLAFAAQLISVAWVIRTFELPSLGWLLKLLVIVLVARLTLNPWLIDYPAEVHWTLWTYGGSTLCGIVAAMALSGTRDLARWAEGAALHLFVLTCWVELRYVLYDGEVFRAEFTLLEASLYVTLFGSISIVYFIRSGFSVGLERVYRAFSYVELTGALVCYAWIVGATLTSAPWVWNHIDSRPIFNLMLLSYGMPVLLSILVRGLHARHLRSAADRFGAIAFLIFISLEIRHLWQGSVHLGTPTESGELYTYSAVWLAIAIAAILAGIWRFGQTPYRAGMLLLAVVIGKIFLVDMSGLEGLLRVASFMGLGLALLGVSYLHRELQAAGVSDQTT